MLRNQKSPEVAILPLPDQGLPDKGRQIVSFGNCGKRTFSRVDAPLQNSVKGLI